MADTPTKSATLKIDGEDNAIELPIYSGNLGPDVIDVGKLTGQDRDISRTILDLFPPLLVILKSRSLTATMACSYIEGILLSSWLKSLAI